MTEGAVTPIAPHVELAPADENPPIEVHRFGLPDLETKGAWIHGRLCSFMPNLAPNFLAATLRGFMESNEYLFLCAPRSVGLARVTRHPFNVKPSVEELFVFITDDGGVTDGLEIYAAMHRWAAGLGANELIIGAATDLKQTEIAKRLGKVRMKTVFAIVVG